MKLLKMVSPFAVAKGAVGLAGSAVGVAETVARETTHLVLSVLHHLGQGDEQPAPTAPSDLPVATDVSGRTDPAVGGGVVTDREGVPKGPTIVAAEPHVPDEPPIDVVGETLAAEAALGDRESPEGAGVAHEPRGASRDEEHGDASLQRAEVEGIAEETAAALEGDDDPDLEEGEHLTEPLLDPAEAKRIAAEMETSMRAADPHKG
jgi:hypothetical protein